MKNLSKKLLLISFLLLSALSQAQTCVPSCQLPDYWGGGQLVDMNNINTKPDPDGLYTAFKGSAYWAWVKWEDQKNSNIGGCDWNNPGIINYDVIIYNKNGTIFLAVKGYEFHSGTGLYPYNALPLEKQRSGAFYMCFPTTPGSYDYELIVNCADGSKPSTGKFNFDVIAAAAPPVPSLPPNQKQTKKK